MVWGPAERPRLGRWFAPEKSEKDDCSVTPYECLMEAQTKKDSGAFLPRSKKKEEKGEMK